MDATSLVPGLQNDATWKYADMCDKQCIACISTVKFICLYHVTMEWVSRPQVSDLRFTSCKIYYPPWNSLDWINTCFGNNCFKQTWLILRDKLFGYRVFYLNVIGQFLVIIMATAIPVELVTATRSNNTTLTTESPWDNRLMAFAVSSKFSRSCT